MDDDERCHYCGCADEFPEKPKTELRPYGPGGSWVCAGCALDGGPREADAAAAFGAITEAQSVVGPVVITDSTHRRPTV